MDKYCFESHIAFSVTAFVPSICKTGQCSSIIHCSSRFKHTDGGSPVSYCSARIKLFRLNSYISPPKSTLFPQRFKARKRYRSTYISVGTVIKTAKSNSGLKVCGYSTSDPTLQNEEIAIYPSLSVLFFVPLYTISYMEFPYPTDNDNHLNQNVENVTVVPTLSQVLFFLYPLHRKLLSLWRLCHLSKY